jgi:hypothetical protein
MPRVAIADFMKSSLPNGLRPERMDSGRWMKEVVPLKRNGERGEKFVVVDPRLGGRSAGNSVDANRLEINERCIGRREARDRLRRLKRQLDGGLRKRNTPGVAGLAIVVVGAMPVEGRVKA